MKISPGEPTRAIVTETALVMKERLRAAHLTGAVAATRSGYFQVTLNAAVPTAYSSRLLTQMGTVTFRIVPKGDLYRSPSARPIRSASVESTQEAAAQGVITNRPVLFFTVSDPASFARFTRAHVNQSLGVYFDERLISAPMLKGPIYDKGFIVGRGDSAQELGFIAAILTAGPLPARVKFLSSSGIIRS